LLKNIKKKCQKFQKSFIVNIIKFLKKWKIFKKKKNWYKQKTYAYEMPRSRSIDIDDINDFNLAKLYFKFKEK